MRRVAVNGKFAYLMYTFSQRDATLKMMYTLKSCTYALPLRGLLNGALYLYFAMRSNFNC